jgi:hypothetical protein
MNELFLVSAIAEVRSALQSRRPLGPRVYPGESIGIIPVHLSGSGTIYFKLIDYDDNFDASYNWDNNSVSNELSQPITIH